MADVAWTIYTAPAEQITADLLRSFLAEQRRDRLFLESLTLELKRQRDRHNVLTAIAGMANTAGGIVLLGVDEDEPGFDESPGVTADEVTSVLGQCQSGLSPAVTPELIPVAIPDNDRIVLVIRVISDPLLWPVVKNGQVFVRNPGQTVAATHEQILDLVRRRETPSATVPMFHLTSIYTPTFRDAAARAREGDLVLRFASAVYARPGLPRPVTLGSEERAAVSAAVGSSVLVQLLQGSLPRGSHLRRDVLPLAEDERSSTMYRAHGDCADGGDRHRLSLRLQCNGPQVSFAVDVHVRLAPHDGPEVRTPRFGRSELVLGLLCGLETVSLSLIPVIAKWLGGAPSRVDDVYCWIESPRSQGLGEAIDKQGAARPLAGERTIWALQVPPVSGADEAAELVRHPLETLYVDLGFDDERAVLGEDLRRALEERQYLA